MRAPHPTIASRMLATLLIVGAGLVGAASAQTTSTTTSTTVSGPTTTSTTTSTSTTTVPPALRCKNRLLNRGKKLSQRLTRCAVLARKRAKKGKPFDEAACAAKGLDRYDRTTTGSVSFAKGCLSCTLDAVAPVRSGIPALAATLDALIGCAPEVPIAERAKCEIRLRKAASGYQAAIMRCRKDAALLAAEGGTPDELQCILDARARFDAKASRLVCPPCVDPDRIAGTTFEDVDDLITLAHCPCRFGDESACGECRECAIADGCVAADQGAPCGRNGCTKQSCVDGTCVTGSVVACADGDVCTVDVCVEDEDPTCQGAECCVHEPLCNPDDLDPCVLECSCDPVQGCACRCEVGCPYPGCVIFTP